MKIDIISFTDKGHILNRQIAGLMGDDQITSWGRGLGLLSYVSLEAFAQEVFPHTDALIFIGAAGIAVRAVAPHLRGKGSDPAVIVMDEAGRFVIPILSGHIGGANNLALKLAKRIGAQPVITTATDVSGVFSPDNWAARSGCVIPDTREIKAVSAALLRGEPVGFLCDFPVIGPLPTGLTLENGAAYGIVITTGPARREFAYSLHIVPKCVHIGIGCRKDTDPGKLKEFVNETFEAYGISLPAVKTVSSIDLKKEEPALVQLGQALDRPFYVYSAEELNRAVGAFQSSEFVQAVTGTDNVCQRAAALSAGGGRVLIEKTARDGMTLAAVEEEWRAVF